MANKCTTESSMYKKESKDYSYLGAIKNGFMPNRFEDLVLQGKTINDAQKVINERTADIQGIRKRMNQTKLGEEKIRYLSEAVESLHQIASDLGLLENPFISGFIKGINGKLKGTILKNEWSNISDMMSIKNKNIISMFNKLSYKDFQLILEGDKETFDTYFGDHKYYKDKMDKAQRMMRFMTGQHEHRTGRTKKVIHQFLAKIPAMIKVGSYSMGFGLFGPVSGMTLFGISMLGTYNNRKYIQNERAKYMPGMTSKQKKEFYETLGIANNGIFDTAAANKIFGDMTWGSFFQGITSGASGPDIMMREVFAKFGYEVAAQKYWDNERGFDENINMLKAYMKNPETRNDIINTAQTIARSEAGAAQFKGGEMTDWGTIGLMTNILGAWSHAKAMYYIRGLAQGRKERKHANDLEVGRSSAEEDFIAQYSGNSDMGIIISMLGHGIMTGFRIAAAMEADDGDDEDDIFEKMIDIFLNSNQGLAAISSNPYTRTVFDMVSAIYRSAGFGDEDELLSMLEEYDPTVRYKYGTSLFMVDQMNKLLAGAKVYTGMWMNIQKNVRDPDQSTAEGIFRGMMDYADRLDSYLNEELYISNNDPEFRSMGSNAILNLITGTQSNPFKKYQQNTGAINKWLKGTELIETGAGSDGVGGGLLGMMYAMGPGGLVEYMLKGNGGARDLSKKGANIYKITDAVSRDKTLYNFVYNSDGSGLSNNEAAYGYHQAVSPWASYNIELDPKSGVRINNYNEWEMEAVESTLNEFLGEERMGELKKQIKEASSKNRYDRKDMEYLAETSAFLEVIANSYRGRGEESDQRANIVGQQFLAFIMDKAYEETYKSLGYKNHSLIPENVQKAIQSNVYRNFSELHRLTDKASFESVVNFAIYERNENLRDYFTDPYTSNGAAIKDININGSRIEQNIWSGVMLGMEKIANGKDLGQIGVDIQKLYNSSVNNIAFIEDGFKEQLSILKRNLVLQNAHITDMARKSGIYSDEDIAYFTANAYINNPTAYAEFLSNENESLEVRERVASILYDAKIVTELFDVDDIINPSDKLQEYYGDNYDSKVGTYRSLSGGGKRYSNNYYKPLYSQYRTAYNNPLENFIQNYARKIFGNGGVKYNNTERTYLKTRSRLNRVDTVYPVFDLSGLGASSGFSEGTSVSAKKFKAGDFAFQNKRGGRLVRKGGPKIKVKKGSVSFEES